MDDWMMVLRACTCILHSNDCYYAPWQQCLIANLHMDGVSLLFFALLFNSVRFVCLHAISSLRIRRVNG